MTSPEYIEYERLTKGMEFKFAMLTFDFLGHCENIIEGEEYKDLRYFCFHFYNEPEYDIQYNRFCVVMERLYREIDETKFPNLKNGFSNLIIFLREPKARENDLEYKNANIKYWRDMVSSDEELSYNTGFKKYIKSVE